MTVNVSSGSRQTISSTQVVQTSYRSGRHVTADTTAAFGEVLEVDATAGIVNVNLPTPESNKESIIVVKFDDTANAVNIIGTVNGVQNRAILNQNESIEVYPMVNGYRVI